MEKKFRTIEELRAAPKGSLDDYEEDRLRAFKNQIKPAKDPGPVSITVSATAGVIAGLAKGLLSKLGEVKDDFVETGRDRIHKSHHEKIEDLVKEFSEIEKAKNNGDISEEEAADASSVVNYKISELKKLQ